MFKLNKYNYEIKSKNNSTFNDVLKELIVKCKTFNSDKISQTKSINDLSKSKLENSKTININKHKNNKSENNEKINYKNISKDKNSGYKNKDINLVDLNNKFGKLDKSDIITKLKDTEKREPIYLNKTNECNSTIKNNFNN